jgi:hypothetical protein
MLTTLAGSLPILLVLGSLPLALPAGAQQAQVSAASGDSQAIAPWLVRHQAEDGRWKGDDVVGDIGVTALVLTAFAGDGNLPHVGPMKGPMRKGLQWLVARQDADSGVFGSSLDDERGLLEHAWSTLLVSELAFLDPEICGAGDNHRRAAKALLAAQREDGSFGSDRATGWAAYALVSAKQAGVDVPDDVLLRARRALVASVSSEGPLEELDVGPLALRALIGFMVDDGSGSEGDAAANAALARLVQAPDLWGRLDPEERMLVAYASYQAGGETWKRAQREMKTEVLAFQQRGTDEDPGGFPPEQGFGAERATAFGALTLEVYYRYARILGAR